MGIARPVSDVRISIRRSHPVVLVALSLCSYNLVTCVHTLKKRPAVRAYASYHQAGCGGLDNACANAQLQIENGEDCTSAGPSLQSTVRQSCEGLG